MSSVPWVTITPVIFASSCLVSRALSGAAPFRMVWTCDRSYLITRGLLNNWMTIGGATCKMEICKQNLGINYKRMDCVRWRRKTLQFVYAVGPSHSSGLLKALNTSPPGKPVHLHQTRSIFTARRLVINISFIVCYRTDTHLYSWVNWGIVGRTEIPKLRNRSNGDSNPGPFDLDFGILSLSYRAPGALEGGASDGST